MICIDKECHEAVEQRDGRWYITNGHPGFTHKQNERSGFHSREKALEVFHGSVEHGMRYNGLSLNNLRSLGVIQRNTK
jgi:hypothetical protein